MLLMMATSSTSVAPRLAAKNKLRASMLEVQARKMLIKKLGLLIEMAKLDEASFEEFQQTFTTPLSQASGKPCGYSFLGGAGVAVR
jgi:hypothetical protein